MDPKITAALIGSFGIFLSASLAYVGFAYKSRLEIKRSARKVLFLLLEIRHETIRSMFDPKDAADKYFEYMSERMEEKGYPMGDADSNNPLREVITTHFENMFSAMKVDIHTRLLEPFDDSLSEFSTINPVLAYRLRGKEKLEKLISHTHTYEQNYKNEIESQIKQTWLKDAIFNSTSDLKEETLAELVEDLDSDILILAKYCGFKDYRSSKKLLSNSNLKAKGFDFSGADHLIDNVIAQIMEASKVANKGPEETIVV